MPKRVDNDRGLSRRNFIKAGAAALAGPVFGCRARACETPPNPRSTGMPGATRTGCDIYHAVNGTPAQNVAAVFQQAYGGIENFIGRDDIVLLRPNLQWSRNGYTNTDIGMGLIDLILNRPGGFDGEIIVVENHFTMDIYLITFTLQVIFYLFVLAGKGISDSRIRLKFFFLPYYLYIMNYSNIAGIWRFIRGSQSVKWEKAGRAK